MASPFGRIGLAGAPPHPVVKRQSTCNLAAGDLYTSPASRATVDATKPIKFEWNTACNLDAPLIDLYLYEPNSALIQAWQNVEYSSGSFEVQLRPKWWNSTTTAELQLSIMPAGAPSWDTRSPAGPFFTVNYPESAMFTTVTQGGDVKTNTAEVAATASADGIFNDVSSTKSGGLSKGAIAAAVIVPIIVVAAAVAVAIKFWRSRESEKRKRWSQAMSTHSGMEWEKGALPGDRPPSNFGSAVGRASISSQQPRPMSYATSSIYAVENNNAGRGAGGFARPPYTNRSVSNDNVGSIRSSVVLPDGNVRQSRISFAENARPDRRSRLSLGGDIRPNVAPSPKGMFKMAAASKSATQLELATPAKKSSYATGSAIADEEEEGISISPSQHDGPGHFSDNEMQRAGHSRRTGRRSIMSFGGGDKRRESTASALSAEDFKSAASARGSVDELRDLEGMILHRRSMMSQNSGRSPRFDSSYAMPNADHVEALDNETTVDMPAQPSPIAGAQTVAYGPDQMLAVYAARGKVNSPSPSASPAAVPQASGSASSAQAAAIAQPRPTAKRLLSNLTKRGEEQHAPVTTQGTGEMRSLTHLNNGTVSSAAVDALPPPGPQGSLRPPTGRTRSNTTTVRASGASENSTYSDDHIGSAQ